MSKDKKHKKIKTAPPRKDKSAEKDVNIKEEHRFALFGLETS